MAENMAIKLFESKKIRTHWDADQEKWYFSLVDVVQVLTDQPDTRRAAKYWSVLKNRLRKESNELTTFCSQLKMPSADGKQYKTDVADTEQLLRIIQSIPSPKAEPFKQWLAKVGADRMDEMADPELTFDRAVATYKQKGYSDNWINQRVKSIQVRKDLTDEWDRVGIKKGQEYAILTDELTKAWADRSVKEYKQLKGLRKENLRDNMSDIELIFNMLAEASTKEISVTENPDGFQESKQVARRGGTIAGDARKALEKETKRKVVSPANAKDAKLLDTGFAEDGANQRN